MGTVFSFLILLVNLQVFCGFVFIVLFFIPGQLLLRLTDVICDIIVQSQCNLLCLKMVLQLTGSLCCVIQGQMTVNGGLTVPASPRIHLQRPFSPSTYPPPPSLSPSITAMQQARTTGEYWSLQTLPCALVWVTFTLFMIDFIICKDKETELGIYIASQFVASLTTATDYITIFIYTIVVNKL